LSNVAKRLIGEAVGWVLTAIGAYFVYEDTSNTIAYIILVIGILLVLTNFLFIGYKKRK
jgi:Zn-dependent membrane protease YugP